MPTYAAKAEFAKIEAGGVIQRLDSAWPSPLSTIRKVEGSWRRCSDYRCLNLVTQPVPNIQRLSSRLTDAKSKSRDYSSVYNDSYYSLLFVPVFLYLQLL